MYSNERGNVTLNILLVIMLVVIGVLIYILASGTNNRIGRTIGIDTPHPNAVQNAPSRKSTYSATGEFSDGLGRPESVAEYQLDEFGAGIARRDVFRRDINGDGIADRITRQRVENGTAHGFDQYIIELNTNGKFSDITPDEFRTIEGAECALQKLQFTFAPTFQVIKISRPWRDAWDVPTMATKTLYSLVDNEITIIKTEELKTICDVTALF